MTQLAFDTGVPSLSPRVPSTEEMMELYRDAWHDSWTEGTAGPG
jgi:hypothetical protein